MTASYTNSPVFRDFCTFATAQIRSGDIDPVYPLLKHFYAAEGLDHETALWRTLCYVTWYHLGSAELAWSRFRQPFSLAVDSGAGRFADFKTGIERRGFRGNHKAEDFLRGAVFRATHSKDGSLCGWVDRTSAAGGWLGWDAVRYDFEVMKHGGPWSSYKWADLLKHVHGVPITASSIGDKLGETAGPIPGMVRVTGIPWQECARNVGAQRDLLDAAINLGAVPFSGLDQLETALCDFNSLAKGGYYIGHDIDALMDALQGCSPGLWEARAVFPDAYRGELGGWHGVRKGLKTRYRDQGILVNLP